VGTGHRKISTVLGGVAAGMALAVLVVLGVDRSGTDKIDRSHYKLLAKCQFSNYCGGTKTNELR
jgi:hypothetical protein